MGCSVRARVLAVCLAAAGCATCPKRIESALRQPAADRAAVVARAYTVACPDRLNLRVDHHRELTGSFTVEADGCLALGELGRVRVDGATTGDVAGVVAGLLRISPSAAHVDVAEHASRQVVLFGPGDGVQRVVPYVGPEIATDLLRRTGGLAPGAAFHFVHVVRPHVAAGRRPEVFTVDLRAIVEKNDATTDVPLEPYDQVYVGETRGSSVGRCLPPWLRAAWPGIKTIDSPPELGKD